MLAPFDNTTVVSVTAHVTRVARPMLCLAFSEQAAHYIALA